MTDKQKSITRQLRQAGNSYSQISALLDLSEGTIKTFCRRNNLTEADINQHKESV